MLKKVLALVMCIVLMCGMGVVVSAQNISSFEDYNDDSLLSNSEIQPRYNYVNTLNASIKDSNGKALCGGVLRGYNGTTTKIVMTMTLQKKTLLWWSKVEEWTTTVNSYQATLSKTATVESGKYRVKVEATVYSGSNSEEVSCISGTCEF